MKKITILLSYLLLNQLAQAAEIIVRVNDTTTQTPLGTVVFSEGAYGVLITPNLSKLVPGMHGFHLHQHANCGAHGTNAGAHFDPEKTNAHLGPYGAGHLGDLPVLYVDKEGKANTPTIAPRLKLNDLYGLAVMIHAGGDNYSDTPPLGGGGAREACGVIPKQLTAP